MKNFKFKITSECEEPIDNIISCLLPHDKFSSDEAKLVIEELNRALPIDETSGVYYVFMLLFKRLNITRLYLHGYTNILDRDVFDNAVMGGIRDIIIDEAFEAGEFFDSYGKHYDLSVPQQYEEAAAFAYSVLMEKYDELFAKAVPTDQGLSWVSVLKQNMEYAITARMLDIASTILTTGITKDRKLLRGPAETRRFLNQALADVNARIQDVFSDSGNRFRESEIISFDKSKEFDAKNKVHTRELYYMGIDPIDDVLPIRTQDIITVIADEGIGKTRFAIDQAYRALMTGTNVLYICGETAQIKIKKYIESMHCYNLYNIQLDWIEVDDPSRIKGIAEDEVEDIQIKINAALADLYENKNYGSITFLQSASYEDFIDTIKENKSKHNIDLVIVDHVLALTSTGTVTTLGRLTTKQLRVSYLYECEDILVKECDIAFLNTSHPSVSTSADLKAGRAPGARAGAESSDSTKYSSHVMVLNNDSKLRKQDLVIVYITKLRDARNAFDPIILKRSGYANIHVFDPKLQYLGKGGSSDGVNMNDLFMTDSEDE